MNQRKIRMIELRKRIKVWTIMDNNIIIIVVIIMINMFRFGFSSSKL